jgi:hypothetical protein
MPKVWDAFEWDDENKKTGNVQHLREYGIEPKEAEERLVFQDKGYRLARIFTGWDLKPKKKTTR